MEISPTASTYFYHGQQMGKRPEVLGFLVLVLEIRLMTLQGESDFHYNIKIKVWSKDIRPDAHAMM